jgi:hypothetical protein
MEAIPLALASQTALVSRSRRSTSRIIIPYLWSCRDVEACARLDTNLGQRSLRLDEISCFWIGKHTDCFVVTVSRGYVSVAEVVVIPNDFSGLSDDVCDQVGQAVANLQALKRLRTSSPKQRHCGDDDDDDDGIDDEYVDQFVPFSSLTGKYWLVSRVMCVRRLR